MCNEKTSSQALKSSQLWLTLSLKNWSIDHWKAHWHFFQVIGVQWSSTEYKKNGRLWDATKMKHRQNDWTWMNSCAWGIIDFVALPPLSGAWNIVEVKCSLLQPGAEKYFKIHLISKGAVNINQMACPFLCYTIYFWKQHVHIYVLRKWRHKC